MNACERPGCAGHYAPDGYCDECGHKAPTTASGGGASGPVTGGVRADGIASAPVSGLTGISTGSHGFGGGTGTTGRGRTVGRGRLGANLVVVPPVPLRDPAGAVLTDPSVGESHRFCGNCGEPVGRGRDGQPGRTEGFCPRDRTRYSFVPSLKAGDLLDGRYEILGCIAHGGLGWIYLGRDRNISDAGSDRWVVLKGLINTGDEDAMAAAVAERRFLVEVDHPNIVKIHDFADHPDPITGENIGYIVMEYVGGRSLKELALAYRGPTGGRAPLPLPQVLAYGLEILPALGYLHDRGLLFCDFKPDNVIHTEEQLKLIDLGAVRRMGDDTSALYGTPGYQAPELATVGPSVGSDLYTVGRTLAVLSFDFSGFTSKYAQSLPDATDVPLLAAEESYYRLLKRATHLNPARRFESAGDMADQLLGVLREVLSAADGVPRPAPSSRFTTERRTFGSDVDSLTGADVVSALPLPLVDPTDPGAGFLATLGANDPAQTVAALAGAPGRGIEVSLRLVRAHLEAGEPGYATDELATAAKLPGADWRVDWYAGLIALATDDHASAAHSFDAVYEALPGEIAAQLALAATSELAGIAAGAAEGGDARRYEATRRYERVWRVDHGYTSAAFGLARTRAAAGDRAGAIGVLDEVPDSSSQYVSARVAALRIRLGSDAGTLTETDLLDASGRLERLGLDSARQARMSVEMFEAALRWVAVPAAGASVPRTGRVLGHGLTERELRIGLERAYRLLATFETDTLARYALVDAANAVRPRTVV